MDHLFREGSEKYDFEYTPAAWEQMNALLDKQQRRRRIVWWMWGGITAFALLITLSLLFFIKNENTRQANLPAPSGQPHNNPENKTPLPDSSSATAQLPAAELNEDNMHGQQPPTARRLNFSTQKDTPSPKSTPSAGAPNEVFSEEQTTTKIPAPTPLPGKEHPIGPSGLPPTVIHKTPQQNTTPHQPIAPGTIRHGLLLPLPLLPISTTTTPPPPPLLPAPQPALTNPHKPSLAQLLIGLTGGPELNSAGQGDYSELNWKAGIRTDLLLANRFALSAGVNYLQMWYDVGEGEYIPEKGFWTDGVAPVSTRARCKMLEVPLLLGYHFNTFHNDGFYATAGLTSYFFLQERYWYKYDNPVPGAVLKWGSDENEMYWFNYGHFEAGYRKVFSGKWSVQAGPFMQTPLKGIGHGNVKLYSIGLNAVVSFRAK